MNGCELTASISALASLMAGKLSDSELALTAAVFTQLGQLTPGEKITAMIPIHEYSDDKNLFMVTKTGIVKKTPLMEFSNVRKNGLTAINLREEDELIEGSALRRKLQKRFFFSFWKLKNTFCAAVYQLRRKIHRFVLI